MNFIAIFLQFDFRVGIFPGLPGSKTIQQIIQQRPFLFPRDKVLLYPHFSAKH